MFTIQKCKETMSSKERVRLALNFEKTDRVPIDYSTNSTVNSRLKTALGLSANDSQDDLLDILGVDYRSISVPYTGKPLFPERDGMSVDAQYGFYYKWIENEFGGYNDFCYFPLKGASSETIHAFPAPNPDDFDYSLVTEQVHRYRDKAIYVGSAGISDIINSLGRVMGMEDTLVNLLEDDEATLDLANRKVSFELGKMERMLDAIVKAGGTPDFLWIGEDLGTQIAPMISKALFRKIFRPIMQRFVNLANAYSIPVMVHTCGSSSWAYEDFIEMGIRAVDTLQPEAANMSPIYLAEKFGGRLAMHGCISTAMLANLSVPELEKVCRRTLETLMPVGGYQFAPTHMIQDNTPVENIVAMYNAAHQLGRY